MTIDEFLQQLQKPQYVYVMARGQLNSSWVSPPMRKSATTRMRNAEKEIRSLVEIYASYMEDDD